MTLIRLVLPPVKVEIIDNAETTRFEALGRVKKERCWPGPCE
jgi:hypothetical protein